MKEEIKEEYEVSVKINKIQNNGCFCTFLGLKEGYGFMPQYLMSDHYNNGVCDLDKGDTINAYIHEIKADGFIILSDEFIFKQKLAKEKTIPIEQLNISELGLGIVLGGTRLLWSFSSKYMVVLCADSTLRFIDTQKKSVNTFLEKIQTNDIVLVDITKTDEVEFVIPLSELHYYESDAGQYNELISEKTNCEISNIYINENDFFIFNKESVYGDSIEGYCRYRKTIYILHNLNDTETNLIRDFFNQNSLKEPKEIIEDIEAYLTDENITKIIESFTITNEEYLINRPGNDDYYYIDKVSKEFEDEYINSLFPNIKDNIHRDRGFCTAASMRIDFEKRPYKDEELDLINEAKKKYNKEEHRVYLLKQYFSEFMNKQKIIYAQREKYHSMFVGKIIKMLLNDVEGFEFGKEYNILLRNYYKKVNQN